MWSHTTSTVPVLVQFRKIEKIPIRTHIHTHWTRCLRIRTKHTCTTHTWMKLFYYLLVAFACLLLLLLLLTFFRHCCTLILFSWFSLSYIVDGTRYLFSCTHTLIFTRRRFTYIRVSLNNNNIKYERADNIVLTTTTTTYFFVCFLIFSNNAKQEGVTIGAWQRYTQYYLCMHKRTIHRLTSRNREKMK